MSVLLDTRIWVWWLTPGSPLSRAERNALDASAGRHELFISAISLWEVQVLHAKRRLELPLPFAEWLARAADDRVIAVLPLNVDANAINGLLYAKLPFNAQKDFVPVTQVATSHLLLVMHPSVPVKSVKDVIALAKSHPGKLNNSAPTSMKKSRAGRKLSRRLAPGRIDILRGQRRSALQYFRWFHTHFLQLLTKEKSCLV